MVVRYDKIVTADRSAFFLLCSLLLLCGCQNQTAIDKFLKEGGSDYINRKYVIIRSLAQIVNPPIATEREQLFELTEDTDVRVYGVGELIPNFANVSRKYFFLSDDVELFWKKCVSGKDALAKEEKIIFSWADGVKKDTMKYEFKDQDAISMKGFMRLDTINEKYFAEIRMPWKSFGIDHPERGRVIELDFSVGDTDEHFVQEGKLSWRSSIDPLYHPPGYGKIILTDSLFSSSPRGMFASLKGSPAIDWKIDDCWNNCPVTWLENLVAGEIKDKYDLSARFRSCWDDRYLYFLAEIQDGNQNRIIQKELLKEQTFLDYGWIETESGQKIWEMHAIYSKHAGGAIKNQLVDSVLHLKKGRYKLKYTSDESHAFGDWDDRPPATGFFGIAVYQIAPEANRDKK